MYEAVQSALKKPPDTVDMINELKFDGAHKSPSICAQLYLIPTHPQPIPAKVRNLTAPKPWVGRTQLAITSTFFNKIHACRSVHFGCVGFCTLLMTAWLPSVTLTYCTDGWNGEEPADRKEQRARFCLNDSPLGPFDHNLAPLGLLAFRKSNR
jgi:hypothetical protein